MGLNVSVKTVLLIDIPTYKVTLPTIHKELLEKRLILQSALWENRVGSKMIRPGLTYSRGLLTIAACLERKGFKVRYLVHSDPEDRVLINDLAKEADAILITAMTPTFDIVVSICNNVKRINADIITIIGGPHITTRPIESLTECQSADFAMIGECEERLPELLKNIENPESIGGTAYRDNKDVKISTFPTMPISITELPMPAYHLLSRGLNEYAHNIRTMRGCPYQCNFCFERLTCENSYSEHSVEQIIAEIKLLSSQLTKGTLVHFSDAIFNINWERTAQLIEQIRGLNTDLQFSFDTRADLINSNQVKILDKANFLYIRMGFESLQNNILDISQKMLTHSRQEEASDIIRSISSRTAIHAYMITGLPGSDRDTISSDSVQMYNMVRNKHVDIVGNKIMVPYPGTPYYDNPQSLGIKINTYDWSKYDRRSFPVYCLDKLSSDEIYYGYLMQEATLNTAYTNILKDVGNIVDHNNPTKDYIFVNYVE